MMDDAALLRRYVEEGSETAFAELVRRHVDLVYGAALRRTGGDSHRAADIAQQVFTTLARQARRLSGHPVLSAWLHRATRNAALNLMISEQRRKARELEAATLAPAIAGGEAEAEWDRVRPALDAAIDELPEPDRAAVVLRFLERRAFAEIGAVLKVSEDAARMRTERALDKLRTLLARRGITSTAVALGAMVAGQPAVSAPAGLAATLASTSVAAAGTGLLVAFNALISTKTILTAGCAAVVAFMLGGYLGLMRNPDQPALPALESPPQLQLIASLRKQNVSLRSEIDRLNAANASLAEQRAASAVKDAAARQRRTASSLSVGEQQRAMLNMLRQLNAAREQFQLENGRPPVNADELVGVDKYVKQYLAVDGEDYRGVSMVPGTVMTVTTPGGVTVTFDPTGATTTRYELPPAMARLEELERKIEPAVMKAVESYRLANQGKNPQSNEALIPFFATPQEGADFVEVLEGQKDPAARQAR